MICKECEYKDIIGQHIRAGKRLHVFCRHPDQDYIKKYCDEHHIGKMPGFICMTVIGTTELTTKSSPRWCPLKMRQKDDEEALR